VLRGQKRVGRSFYMYPTKYMCKKYLKKGESPPAK
jgi:hypothetical protein